MHIVGQRDIHGIDLAAPHPMLEKASVRRSEAAASSGALPLDCEVGAIDMNGMVGQNSLNVKNILRQAF